MERTIVFISGLRMRCVVVAFAALMLSIPAFAQGEREKTKQPQMSQKPVPAATPLVGEKQKEKEDPLFRGMEYRPIGPFRGGRSLTASGVPGDPNTYYLGSTGGGVWRSTDGALTWTSVFDK